MSGEIKKSGRFNAEAAEAVFVYSNELLNYKFNQDHPFNQLRVELTYDLLKKMNVLSDAQIIAPRMATDEELELVHTKEFINAVKLGGAGKLKDEAGWKYGIGTGDTPIFPNMHEAAALLVGGTLSAVDHVMTGKSKHALSLGGGLHHGFHDKASGFCIYNDSSVAIQYIRKHYDKKVLYIDTDAHHGDGVQAAFYDNPNVCTLSIHETGRYLFPGTGYVHERGQGQGYGFSFNVPVDAYTEDDSWLEAYRTSFREIIEFFKPDVLFTQNGVDSHYYDPLTHLSNTMRIYREIPKLAHELAHQYCDGRWIAVGGGGYDIWRVVPRAWSFVWLAMLGLSDTQGALPQSWIDQWRGQTPVPLPAKWDDPADIYPAIPRKAEITERNAETVDKALSHIRNNQMKF